MCWLIIRKYCRQFFPPALQTPLWRIFPRDISLCSSPVESFGTNSFVTQVEASSSVFFCPDAYYRFLVPEWGFKFLRQAWALQLTCYKSNSYMISCFLLLIGQCLIPWVVDREVLERAQTAKTNVQANHTFRSLVLQILVQLSWSSSQF